MNTEVLLDNEWVDLFGDINTDVVPLKYVESVSVTFKNNNSWEISLPTDRDWHTIEKNINEMAKGYKHEIEDISFNVDLLKIKNDISLTTTQFLQNNNL